MGVKTKISFYTEEEIIRYNHRWYEYYAIDEPGEEYTTKLKQRIGKQPIYSRSRTFQRK